MKIRCNDGIVRRFNPTREIRDQIGLTGRFTVSACEECQQSFGVHDTKIVKPLWKQHVCPMPKKPAKD